MASLATPLTPQQSLNNILNKLSNKNDGKALALLFRSLYTDLSTMEANHNALLAKLDAIATAAGGSAITGTAFTGIYRNTYGSDSPLSFGINFTAALSAATSGTVTSNWLLATGTYSLYLSNGNTVSATFTNASTSVTWSGAQTANAAASVSNGATLTAVPITGTNLFTH